MTTRYPRRASALAPLAIAIALSALAIPSSCASAAEGLAPVTADPAPAREIVGYYPGWKTAAFPADAAHIDATQLTVVLFAFLDTCWSGHHGNPNPAAGVVDDCHDVGGGATAAPPDGTLVFG